MGFFKNLFGGKKKPKEFSQEEWDKYHEEKQIALEHVLGKMHDLVGHAIIPFEIGGAVDMYYFPNGIAGTGFATMELLQPDGTGPKPNRLGTYELVAFTKEVYRSSEEETLPFNAIERRMCGIMTGIGAYSFQAKLEPGETIEVPGAQDEPNKCIVLDEYKPNDLEFRIGNKRHGLLLIIEVFKEEMEFAMKNGSKSLLEKLRDGGHYPYSDLNRKSVVTL